VACLGKALTIFGFPGQTDSVMPVRNPLIPLGKILKIRLLNWNLSYEHKSMSNNDSRCDKDSSPITPTGSRPISDASSARTEYKIGAEQWYQVAMPWPRDERLNRRANGR